MVIGLGSTAIVILPVECPVAAHVCERNTGSRSFLLLSALLGACERLSCIPFYPCCSTLLLKADVIWPGFLRRRLTALQRTRQQINALVL